jgi:hypothetical protein
MTGTKKRTYLRRINLISPSKPDFSGLNPIGMLIICFIRKILIIHYPIGSEINDLTEYNNYYILEKSSEIHES